MCIFYKNNLLDLQTLSVTEFCQSMVNKSNLCQGVAFLLAKIVVIVDEAVPRHDWSLGRVVDVEGTSPHVRRAHVRRADGRIVTRDRTKIVRLEMDS